MKKLCLLLILVFGFVLCGCSSEKTFECDAGLQINLDSSFYEKEIVSQTYYLESLNVIFTALKEDKSTFESVNINFDSYTLKQYVELVKMNNNITNTVQEEDGLMYFDYEKNVSGKDFFYRAYVLKGSDAFWLCQFACTINNKDKYTDSFNEWAKTIVVK